MHFLFKFQLQFIRRRRATQNNNYCETAAWTTAFSFNRYRMNVTFYSLLYYKNNTCDNRKTIRKLTFRAGDAKCNMEKMYLLFEIVKCHLQLGFHNLKNAHGLVKQCFKLAHQMNCHPYKVNSAILIGLIEFYNGITINAVQAFDAALVSAHKMEAPGVVQFMLEVNITINTIFVLEL